MKFLLPASLLLLVLSCRVQQSYGFTPTRTTKLLQRRRPRLVSSSVGVPTTTTTTTTTSKKTTTRLFVKQQQQQQQSENVALVSESSYITPDGFGFSSPARRILQESGRVRCYHRAVGSDTVVDVIDAITSTPADVALVFDDNDSDDSKLLGIFTETDFIKVRTYMAGCKRRLHV
jgi:hypothetical protein